MLTRRTFLNLAVAVTSPAESGKPESDASAFASRIFEKVNEIRSVNGVGPLQWMEPVAECAREQSRRKVELRFAGHNDPERGDVSRRLWNAGIDWSHCAENLFMERGWDDPVNFALVFWWYSQGHQANLLNADFTHSGVGLAQADDGSWFVTQIFLTPPVKNNLKRFR
jgi:uncharacterized protein YkwD